MSKHLERDLETLEVEILALSSRVEEMISKACRALWEKRADLIESVFEQEQSINVREVQIEEHCLKILALHQPVAVDLRRTAAVLKINSDLERIGDLAVNIAERAQALSHRPPFALPDALQSMISLATSMVHDALDAFVRLDTRVARNVRGRDDTVDRLNREVIDLLRDCMREDPDCIDDAIHVFSASRHVERIADHATNIAEDVLYMVEGDIARHRHEDRTSELTTRQSVP